MSTICALFVRDLWIFINRLLCQCLLHFTIHLSFCRYFDYILFNKLENVLFVNPDVAQYIKLCKGKLS